MLRPFVAALARAGADPDLVWRHFVSADNSRLGLDQQIPLPDVWALWDMIERSTGDPYIGLHGGQALAPGALGLIEHIFCASATLGEGIQAVARLASLLQQRTFLELCRTQAAGASDSVLVALRYDLGRDQRLPRHAAEFAMAVLLSFMRRVVDGDLVPRAVAFVHSCPGNPGEYERFFRCPIHFAESSDGLVFAAEDLHRPTSFPDSGLLSSLLAYADELLARMPGSSGLAARARCVYIQCLSEGVAGVAQVARRMGMSRRTLQRRLADLGTSHQELLDRTRRELAERYLTGSDETMGSVARRLGFSEPSAFIRAFRRWTGMRPAEYRRAKTEPPVDNAA